MHIVADENKKHSSCLEDRAAAAALFILLAVLFAVFVLANLFHFNRYMNSDIASDVLLAKVLYGDHFRYSGYWVGSAEICIISPPNVAAFLYAVTKNLLLSAGIATVILSGVLLASMVFFYHKIGFSRLQILLAVLIPFVLSGNIDATLGMLVLYAAYYVSHFFTLFIILYIYADALQHDRITAPECIFSVFLAVITGMQGFHCLIYIYLPLAAAEFLRQVIRLAVRRKENKHGNRMLFLWTLLLAATASVAIVSSSSGSNGTTRNIRGSFSKLCGQVIPDIADLLQGRMAVFSTFFVIAAAVGFYILFRNYFHMLHDENGHTEQKAEETAAMAMSWALVLLLLSFFVMMAAATFTTTDSTPRYYIPLLFITGAGSAVLLDSSKLSSCRWFRMILLSAVILFASVRIYMYYGLLIADDPTGNTNEYHAAEWLESSGYNTGYASFDYANKMTLLTNDSVSIASIDSFKSMQGCKWLTDKRWYPPYRNSDTITAYIVTNEEEDSFGVFLKEYNPTVIASREFGHLHVFVLDKNYTYWSN
jgi:hypothetical protein